MPRVREAIAAAVRSAARYSAAAQARPAAILWPDKERQWEPVICSLRSSLQELYVLGPYDPTRNSGPAVWLKCVLAETSRSSPCILYLPGWSRSDLRATAACPLDLQPLTELQYRGAVWSHPNGRDWSVYGFLTAQAPGLGLQIPRDEETRDALLLAFGELIDMEIEDVRSAGITRDYLRGLVAPTPERDMLEWMQDPDGVKRTWEPARWTTFEKQVASDFKLSPGSDGPLQAAEALVAGGGKWNEAWKLFADLWYRFPGVTDLLLRVRSPAGQNLDVSAERYPSLNEREEDALRMDLLALKGKEESLAIGTIKELETRHGVRRNHVWADMGRSRLAMALQSLSEIADLVSKGGGGSDLDFVVNAYKETYWKVDAAALGALEAVDGPKEREAIAAALEAVYLPWLDRMTRNAQPLLLANAAKRVAATGSADCLCILFIDALRYDISRRIPDMLNKQVKVSEGTAWSALPSMTSVAKPLVSPLADTFRGDPDSGDFRLLSEDGKVLTQDKFKALLTASGWQVLGSTETGDPSGKAWTECGSIDRNGHDRGARLAGEIEDELQAIVRRLEELLDAGWKRIRIVTDHGWLLMPGGLPKADLPPSSTVMKSGRCALLKGHAPGGPLFYHWPLEPSVMAATAPGAGAFKAGTEYAHGGVSLQENLVPVLEIVAAEGASVERTSIASLSWTRLRCEVKVTGPAAGMKVDIRMKPADAATSIAAAVKAVTGGTASLLVPDDGAEGKAAFVVLLAADGSVAAQEQTTVGG